MILYYIADGSACKWKGEPLTTLDENLEPKVVKLPLSIEQNLPAASLNTLGLFKENQIVNPEIPQGQQVVAKKVVVVDNVLTYEYGLAAIPVFEDNLNEHIQMGNTQINDKFYEVMESGYQHNFGTEEEPIYGVLQNRKGSDDATNWLSLKDTCNEYIAAGYGAAPCEMPIKTADNVQHPLTYQETATVLNALKAWGGYNLKMSWELKTLIGTISTEEEYDATVALIEPGIIDELKNLNGWPVHKEL